jgi:hypothetical protein
MGAGRMTPALAGGILRVVFGGPGRESRQEWERIRAGGRTRYVLTRGVLGRGVPMALLVAIGIELYLGGSFPEALTTPGFLGRLLLGLALFSASGILTARLAWNVHERRREHRP